jgi:hypothetical protein
MKTITVDYDAIRSAILGAVEGRNLVFVPGSGHEPQVEVVLFDDGRVDAFFGYMDDFPCDGLAGELASVKVDVGIDGSNIRVADEYAEIAGILIYESEAIFEHGGKRAMEAEAEVDAWWSDAAIQDDATVSGWADDAYEALVQRLEDMASAEELRHLDLSSVDWEIV